MSTARIITEMGAAVALVGGKVKVSGLDRLPAEVAERVLAVARDRREELRRELDPTGLDWLPAPSGVSAPTLAPWWAAFDLADLCRLHGVRIVAAGNRLMAIYPPDLSPELVAYVSALLAESRPYLEQRKDRLPALSPSEAVEAIKGLMVAHKGLRFIRGDGGSLWPLYPKTWTAGQRATVQSLWFVAGPTLDHVDFQEVDA